MGGHSGIWRVNSHFPFVTWQVWCTVMAALLHYFLLCVFTWMFNHGVLLYLLIIKADLRDNIHSKMKWFYTFGWGKRKVNVNLRHHTLFHRGSTQSYWISAVRCKWRRWSLPPHSKKPLWASVEKIQAIILYMFFGYIADSLYHRKAVNSS